MGEILLFNNHYLIFDVINFQDELSSSVSPTKIKGQKRKRHSKTSTSEADKDLVSRAWLRRNAEVRPLWVCKRGRQFRS